jgi:hypothetical protein
LLGVTTEYADEVTFFCFLSKCQLNRVVSIGNSDSQQALASAQDSGYMKLMIISNS